MGIEVDAQPWNIIEEIPLGHENSALPIEGTFRCIKSEGFDDYLTEIGCTPLMASMVMRSDEMVTLYEDIDKQWKLMSERSIKAKSVRGYKTRNFKMISNKFILGEPKPELLDDYDPRLVVSTVTLEDNENKLVLRQIAEKDLKFKMDSVVTWEGNNNGSMITMTCETATGVKAVKTYMRHKTQPHESQAPKNRKFSAPF